MRPSQGHGQVDTLVGGILVILGCLLCSALAIGLGDAASLATGAIELAAAALGLKLRPGTILLMIAALFGLVTLALGLLNMWGAK